MTVRIGALACLRCGHLLETACGSEACQPALAVVCALAFLEQPPVLVVLGLN